MRFRLLQQQVCLEYYYYFFYPSNIMSVTVSNCEQICHAHTNTSNSKMLYSFSKQPRFLQRKNILCDRFYDIKNTISQRSAGFGYGHKYDFTKDQPRSPSPNTYTLHHSPSKGPAFGLSREAMKTTGPLASAFTNTNPGPGNYDQKPIRSHISYSLSGKAKRDEREQIRVPGPGQYQTPFNINKDGRYFGAKHKSSCVRHFGRTLGRSQTAASLSKVPGPGAYNTGDNTEISPQGRYCLSSSQNCLTRKFGSSAQRGDVILNKTTPGPGNYKLPSEFGYYCDKRFVRGEVEKENEKDE